jgi:hypothetical protein
MNNFSHIFQEDLPGADSSFYEYPRVEKEEKFRSGHFRINLPLPAKKIGSEEIKNSFWCTKKDSSNPVLLFSPVTR